MSAEPSIVPAVDSVNPVTGEIVPGEVLAEFAAAIMAGTPAAAAAFMVAAREFEADVLGVLKRVAADRVNAHLDDLGKASGQLQDDAERVFEVKGETAAAARDAIVVTDPEGLAADLQALARRGQLDPAAAAGAVKRTVEYKPDTRVLRALEARQDAVGETVKAYVKPHGPDAPPPRPRRSPTVKRVA